MSAALNRSAVAAPARRPRIVHIGLGAFHRAHQAWYTAKADQEWGITAFTGRSATAAHALAPQEGLYTLVTRGPEEDEFEVVDSILAAHDGNNLPLLTEKLADPATAILTLTITEAGYHMAPGGGAPRLDLDDPSVAADLSALARAFDGRVFAPSALGTSQLELRTVPARILAGLAARRAGDAWPLAVVSCDNLPNNGSVAEACVLTLAERIDEQLAGWIRENVSFVDTSIDRITPRTTGTDAATVAAATGFADSSPVVTEPFSSWVLCGDFPAGRPAWEKAGAQFVDELEPFERRKLWLLNGAHSLMSFAGQLRGHETVAQALDDPRVSGWVEDFWDATAAHLQEPALDIPEYRRSLRARFENPRIAHFLAQIAMDGSIKLAARALPVYRAEREAGRDGRAALRLISAWCEQLGAQRSAGKPIADANSKAIETVLADASLSAGSREQTAALVAVIDTGLARSNEAIEAITDLRGSFAN